MRRALELLGGSGLGHFTLELLEELGLPAFEQQARLVDRLPVALDRADRLDAGREAPLDLVFEARPVAPAVDDLVARAEPEQPVRQLDRPTRERRRHERSGIDVAIALDLARDEHA